ncbi:ParA family partition ATPase [Roseomonas indoligenes]|uniref:ParA family protein n=1 Tax=Roseomonas indoligenes TaxID=2820811 RepID=A0A940S7K2_9PROT|nr:ParA family partition ATPase [Pararoseomonas indoligenes]MBP0493168.1 ParA family protein [Pararoseomonas indoligenes]
MAFVVAVAQRKGGAGKSTVAANLAVALVEAGARVALADTDPQATLTRWHGLRPKDAAPLAFESPSGWRVPQAVTRLGKEADFVVLDTPPHADTDSRVAMRAANLVLIPLQPSMPDVWAMEATLEVAAAEGRAVALMLNRVPAQGRAAQDVAAALVGRKLPLLPSPFGNRTAFAAAFAEGLGVVESAPRGQAAVEARALAEAIQREAS